MQQLAVLAGVGAHEGSASQLRLRVSIAVVLAHLSRKAFDLAHLLCLGRWACFGGINEEQRKLLWAEK